MLTDRGRWILAIGGGTYLVAWAFGALPLYPVALGLVLAVGAAALWVRYLERPMTLLRSLGREEHYAGDDIPIKLEVRTDGVVPSGSLVVVERIARLGLRETPIGWRHGRLRGSYVLENVPRGRYPIESARIIAEDPFGLERAEMKLPLGESILVYPRLVDLDALFSESGAGALEGRRLLLRRPSGFEFHSVRAYEQGESLRRVHWPTTAKRGQLMVKELEDAPRDEVAVLLDADGSAVVGLPPETSFELQVQAAGSILKAHAVRGRRAALVINSSSRPHQRVHSYDGDWHRALELLAGVEADGYASVATLLADEAGTAARALELAVVTAKLTPHLADRLLQRALTHHGASVIYVDASSFAGEAPTRMPTDIAAQILRLERGGVPVAVLRRGDDLTVKLGPRALGAAVG